MHLSKIEVHGLKAAAESMYVCELPGRFSVLTGANAAGKSTLVDAILLAHHDVFPFTPRPSSAVLSRAVPTRTIDITYANPSGVDSPLGRDLLAHGQPAPSWTTTLSPVLGRVSASSPSPLGPGQLPILYLSPTRNPSQDLAGREARLVVELLKAQGLRDRGDKSLKELRGLLGGLIGSVVTKWPVADAEARVVKQLAELTDGVSGRLSFLGTTTIDDTFLARVFEFFIAAADAGRADARRLETEGLGYANLLELAVILAAIPDLTHVPDTHDGDDDKERDIDAGGSTLEDAPEQPEDKDANVPEEVLLERLRHAEQNRQLEDETFFANQFHTVVVLEEPEAHLHPQLQHGLISYLREVVTARPEVQVIITTHSDEIVAACDPEELVVCVRTPGGPAARTIANFGLDKHTLALARRHLDVSRSASIFTDRVVLVEGITDAIVLRAMARIWAADDRIKRKFVESLTITVVGSRIGDWIPQLLTNVAAPIASRLAVLSDSDDKPLSSRLSDAMQASGGRFRVFLSHQSLEPSLVPGNTTMFEGVFKTAKSRPWPKDGEPTEDNVWEYFKNAGRRNKALFADRVAAWCAREPDNTSVPQHMRDLLDFVWDGFLPTPATGAGGISGA